MSRKRIFAAIVLLLAAMTAASGAGASRTAEDSRGLPRLLEEDATDLYVFPAVVSVLGPQFLIDNSAAYYGAPPYYDPSESDEVGLALAGRRFRCGYLLDGSSHNIVLGGPGGWGAILGFQDGYTRFEDLSYDSEDYYSRSDVEEWERTFRLALGWRHRFSGGRLVEAGVEGRLIQAEWEAEYLSVRSGEPTSSRLRWKADAGTGGGVALRTLSEAGGLLAAIRFDYEDLDPESEEIPLSPRVIRRYGQAAAGWRLRIDPLDDVVVGVTAIWSKVEESLADDFSPARFEVDEATRYDGAVFVSVEEEIQNDLVVRVGVRGPAFFAIEKYRRYELEDQEWIVGYERRRSNGSTLAPEFYLGAGWTWKNLSLDARLRDAVDIDDPFVRWSASWVF